jgi:uncharacterized membrane protein
MPSTTVLAIAYFFHLIATVLWVGGLVILTLLVWPEARRSMGNNPSMETLLMGLRRRFMPLTHFSLVVLTVTGLVQMTGDANYDGVLQFDNEWSRVILLKHIAVAGMFACGLVLQFSTIPALERTSLLAQRGKDDPQAWATLRRTEVRLTWINVILGILVLAFTAWATAL